MCRSCLISRATAADVIRYQYSWDCGKSVVATVYGIDAIYSHRIINDINLIATVFMAVEDEDEDEEDYVDGDDTV